MASFWFISGLLLGGAIGANAMWLYLMNKHAGRPIDWKTIGHTMAISLSLLGAMLGWRLL